jgi:peptidoglycan hydrolase-like protein with peptidoglycan-binding domain
MLRVIERNEGLTAAVSADLPGGGSRTWYIIRNDLLNNKSAYEAALAEFAGQANQRIKAWQSVHGLSADGIIGPKTRAAAGEAAGRSKSYGGYAGSQRGAANTNFVQAAKETFLRGYGIKDKKVNSIVAFQKYMGIPSDGLWGPQTARAYKSFLNRTGQLKDPTFGTAPGD